MDAQKKPSNGKKGLQNDKTHVECNYGKAPRKTAEKQAENRIRRFFLNFGRLILDAAKLSFGSLVLGAIIRGDFPQSTVLFWGIIASAAGSFAGLVIVSLSEDK